MQELVDIVVGWPVVLIVLFVFGFLPGTVLRVIVLAFERDDPRRHELLGELRAVPWAHRPLWVAEQIEVALFEGLGERLRWAATGRLIHRWRLASGVDRQQQYPDSFWIPSPDEKDLVLPGDHVKLSFEMNDGWGERMWVRVESIKGENFTGLLSNQPIGIPRLDAGKKVKFRRDHIIDIEYVEPDSKAA